MCSVELWLLRLKMRGGLTVFTVLALISRLPEAHHGDSEGIRVEAGYEAAVHVRPCCTLLTLELVAGVRLPRSLFSSSGIIIRHAGCKH